MSLIQHHASDMIHGVLIGFICSLATAYAMYTHDHSNNIWIVYGSSIAFAAGRAGVSAVRNLSKSNGSAAP